MIVYIDECCQLSSQLIIPEIGLSLPARGLASPIIFSQLPLQVGGIIFPFCDLIVMLIFNFILYIHSMNMVPTQKK